MPVKVSTPPALLTMLIPFCGVKLRVSPAEKLSLILIIAPANSVSSGSVRIRLAPIATSEPFSVKLMAPNPETTGTSLWAVRLIVLVTASLVAAPAVSELASVTCQLRVRVVTLPLSVGSSEEELKVILRSAVW